MNLKEKIRVINDYPIQGISFKDITTLLKDKHALHEAIDQLTLLAREFNFDKIVSPEARGFVFGPAIAYQRSAGFVPVRKPGKLPAATFQHTYDLEYGKDTIEMHQDAISAGDKVIILDDLLATGGTTKAMIEMCEKMGAEVVACIYLVELAFLNPRKELKNYAVRSVIKY